VPRGPKSASTHIGLRTRLRFGNAEVGHVHSGGIVDIPFPRSVRAGMRSWRKAAEGASGVSQFRLCWWFRFGSGVTRDFQHAIWLCDAMVGFPGTP